MTLQLYHDLIKAAIYTHLPKGKSIGLLLHKHAQDCKNVTKGRRCCSKKCECNFELHHHILCQEYRSDMEWDILLQRSHFNYVYSQWEKLPKRWVMTTNVWDLQHSRLT